MDGCGCACGWASGATRAASGATGGLGRNGSRLRHDCFVSCHRERSPRGDGRAARDRRLAHHARLPRRRQPPDGGDGEAARGHGRRREQGGRPVRADRARGDRRGEHGAGGGAGAVDRVPLHVRRGRGGPLAPPQAAALPRPHAAHRGLALPRPRARPRTAPHAARARKLAAAPPRGVRRPRSQRVQRTRRSQARAVRAVHGHGHRCWSSPFARARVPH